ncbi:hypothetical protein A2U01_0039943 [Trifolium medium]|uniref:Uncharacterized protein n=1 Tax=Trifolium medium TaxID=97028 RepID=A0A392Q3V7_9FABA|nr:hypothetical protein [Trifolium medium]
MGKGKKISKSNNEMKKTSGKKNKKTAALSKGTTKPSSKGENSRTCRASPSLKGEQSQPPPKDKQEVSSSESFGTDSDYAEFLLTYDENKEFLYSSDSEVNSK